jgi:hypothetical protein
MLILEGIGNWCFFGGVWILEGKLGERGDLMVKLWRKCLEGELLFVFIFIFGCQLQMH